MEQAVRRESSLVHIDPRGLSEQLELRHRSISPEQRERFEGWIAEILETMGLDLSTPGTLDTPRRFVQALQDATDGYEGDPKLVTIFPNEDGDADDYGLAQIVEGPIPFFALCEHHALPFHGRAFVSYVADQRILGISKLTRLVRVITRRFGVQERMTHKIADVLADMVDARGVAVYLEADHLCTQMRGVHESNSSTRTTAWRGVYEREPALRAEFFELAGLRQPGR
jgi:GTP cyclohydrolase I